MTIISADSSNPVIVGSSGDVILIKGGVTLSGDEPMIQSTYGDAKFFIDGAIFETGAAKAAIELSDTAHVGMGTYDNEILISATGKVYSTYGRSINVDGTSLSLTNAGSIYGSWGMQIQSGGFSIYNTGHISSENIAIQSAASASGTIYNNGIISASYMSLMLMNTTLINDKLIQGTVYSGNGTVENSGTIIGSDSIQSNIFYGVSLSGGSPLSNKGHVSGDGGVYVEGKTSSAIVNSGQIRGSLEHGISIYGYNSLANEIENSGTISGKISSIFCQNSNDTITNSGKLIGDVQLGGGNDVFDTRGGTVKGLIYGGDGNDSYYVDTLATANALRELAKQGSDHVFSSISLTLGDNLENLTLLGTGNLNGSGNSLANRLTGNDGNNRLTGASGNDRLDGGSGADLLDGGSGTDTADYAGSDAAVRIDLATLKVSGGDATGDSLVSIENLVGSRFGDVLSGSKGANVLDGGAGNDRLTGGLGKDVFVFAGSFGKDVVTDFDPSQDRVDLSTITAITDFADLKGHHMSQHGQDTLITVSSSTVITLSHVDMGDLTAGQFLF